MTPKPFVFVANLHALSGATAASDEALPFMTPREATSYAIGATLLRKCRARSVPLDVEQLILGLRDAAAAAPLKLDEAEVSLLVSDLAFDMAVLEMR